MRGYNLCLIIITSKDNMQKFKNTENKHSNIQEIGSEGNFSALYVIIELSPPPHCMCPIHTIPTYIQPLPLPYPIQPPMTIIAIVLPLLRVCRQGGQWWYTWGLPVLYDDKIMLIYPYPFLVVINLFFSWVICINGCICILNGFPG